jgi:tetratricopeptide (TPR) repeat protein
MLYWLVLIVLLAVFIALLIIFRKRAIDRANITKMRGKNANKVATKRLKKAHQLMAQGKQSEFYDEVLKALWGYVGDKLNMPVEQLSGDNISDQLTAAKVDADTVSQFTGAIEECEFERYAPGDAAGNMNKTYDSAINAIMKIEEAMKRNRKVHQGSKSAGGSSYLLLMLFALSSAMMFFPQNASAITKANADNEYAKGNYVQAIKDYEELLKKGGSTELYYNLGNAYYRTDNITRAVINYERALLLSPGDKDVRFNLQMARSKTIDKITPESEMFFVTWYHSLVNLMSVDGWARMSLVSLIVAIILALAYLFSDRIWLRKVGFFAGLLFLVVFVLSNLFAYQQKQALVFRSGAIIIRSAVNVKSTPAHNGTDLFILHEGTKVTITDNTMKEWREIRVADGKEGWLPTKDLEVI